jgi:TPR repeat protein
MGRSWLAVSLSFTMLAACAPRPEPTPAQIAIVQPGIDAERRGNYGFALFTYRYWANWRVGLAQYRLARLYEHGLGTDQDYPEAARWYRAASENGYRPAHLALARLYEAGRGVPQDHAAAFDLYQKAAAGGDVDARDRLLELDHGTAADASAASHYAVPSMPATWMQKARTQNSPRPLWHRQECADCRASAAEGDSRGRLRLARMRAEGDGAAQDEGPSVWPIRSKAETAIDRDHVRPGDLHAAGTATAADVARAVKGNRQGAQQGDGAAAFKVAEAFEHGQGVPPDLVEALAWYGIAERHGYAPAAARVEVLAGALPSVEVKEARRRVDRWWEQFGS